MDISYGTVTSTMRGLNNLRRNERKVRRPNPRISLNSLINENIQFFVRRIVDLFSSRQTGNNLENMSNVSRGSGIIIIFSSNEGI